MIENGAQLCVLATNHPSHGGWLAEAAGPRLAVEAAELDSVAVQRRVAMLSPSCVIVDFSAPHAQQAAGLVQVLRAAWPGLPLIGLGSVAEPQAMLGALRAGVGEFIDTGGQPAEAVKIMQAALRKHPSPAGGQGKLGLLLGARAGLGVTTLACNFALLAQRSLLARKEPADVALLDLGMPGADSLLYLDARGDFSFVDAVRNLRRIDQTLAHTALTRQADGLRLLPLPANLALMREISHGDSVALVRKLRSFFAAQVVDLGGFGHTDFMVQLVHPGGAGTDPQRVWVVCDQGVGAIVSTVQMLTELRDRGVDTGAFGLVVNRFDARAGMSAHDIAQRVGLPLEAVIPERGTALLKAASAGRMLAHTAGGDPYLEAVSGMVRRLLDADGARAAPASQPWWQRAAQLTSGWKG